MKNRNSLIDTILFVSLSFFITINCKSNLESPSLHEKEDNENCTNWISEAYVKCLQNQLPCECEREVSSYFVLKLDINNSTILLLRYGDLEVEQYNLEKTNDSCFMINTVSQNSKNIGKISIYGNKLIFYDLENNEINFQYYGKSEFLNNVTYSKENILLLNKAFTSRGYNSIETILSTSALNCHCTHGQNERLNIVWSDSSSMQWMLEIKNDSLFINTITYPSQDPMSDDNYILNKFKDFKWDLIK